MTEQETHKVLMLLYSEVGKPVPQTKVKVWAEVLRPVPYELGMLAAREMIRLTRMFGEPQMSDYREHVNRLYREAKKALTPPKLPEGSFNDSWMSPEDREALYKRISPSNMPVDQARRIIDATRALRASLPKPEKDRSGETLRKLGL